MLTAKVETRVSDKQYLVMVNYLNKSNYREALELFKLHTGMDFVVGQETEEFTMAQFRPWAGRSCKEPCWQCGTNGTLAISVRI